MFRFATLVCLLWMAFATGCATGKLTSAKQRELIRLKYRELDRANNAQCAEWERDARCVGVPRAAAYLAKALTMYSRFDVIALPKFARLMQKVLVPALIWRLRGKYDKDPRRLVEALLYLEGEAHAQVAFDLAARGEMTVELFDAAAFASARFASALAMTALTRAVARNGVLATLSDPDYSNKRALQALADGGDARILPVLSQWAETLPLAAEVGKRRSSGFYLWWELAELRAQLRDDAFTSTLRAELRRFGVAASDTSHVARVLGYHPEDGALLMSLIQGKNADTDEAWLDRLDIWIGNACEHAPKDRAWTDAASRILGGIKQIRRPRDDADIVLGVDKLAGLLGDDAAVNRLRIRARSSPQEKSTWIAAEHLVALDPAAAGTATLRLLTAELAGLRAPYRSPLGTWARSGEDPGLAWFAMALRSPESVDLLTMARAHPPACSGWLEIDDHLRSHGQQYLRKNHEGRLPTSRVFESTFVLSTFDDDWCAEELMTLVSDDSALFYTRTAALHLMVVQRRPEFDEAFKRVFANTSPADPDMRLFANMRDLWDSPGPAELVAAP